MRRISKNCSKATDYKAWLGTIVGNHPKYKSTAIRNRFYSDIKANLMYCQKGLCAYTELRLDDENYFSDRNVWKKGKYVGESEIQGQLDHFDSTKKPTKAWDWRNFFLCHNSINNAKLAKRVFRILKPDGKEYSPDKFLDYNYFLHKFTVSPKIQDSRKKKQIEEMIVTLGLNYGSIQRLRKKKLNTVFIDFHKKTKQLNELSVDEFHTAFKMTKKKLS